MIRNYESESAPHALIRAMAEQEVPSESKETMLARRERALGVLSRAIRRVPVERERSALIRRRVAAVAAAAVIALGSFGAYHGLQGGFGKPIADLGPDVAVVESVSGTLVVTQAGRARVVASGERPRLVAGDELRTAGDGTAALTTGRSAIDVASATQIRVLAPSSAEERIRLALGHVELRVSQHSEAPRSVVVETPNAAVVVRGTVFSVSVTESSGATNTLVRVSEGSVWVLHDGSRELVGAGEEWSSAAAGRKTEAPEPPPVPASPVVEERTVIHPWAARSKGTASVATQPGTLAEENRMFQSAVDARNRGDDRRAVEAFGGLLSRYPKSRLAEEARVERMRALHRLGDSARASAEARRYLAEHARGFAREEAREAALGSE